MVKVTFNSALAQKEAKKDEPKSGEEALIIPPDAVAVDCKVRGPGRCRGWMLGPPGAALSTEVARWAGAETRTRRVRAERSSPFSPAAPVSCPAAASPL